jgi:DNA-binding FadR family transcriptional regulator
VSQVAAIATPKMAQVVASQIRKRIVTGDLAPGDLLPFEPELVAQFRVSKPIIREAMRILETEGLIEVRRGGRDGARVLEPSVAYTARSIGVLLQYRGTSVADVWEARTLLECDAVEILATLRRPADLRALQDTVDRVEALLDRPSVFAVGSLEFHEELVRLTGNTTLHVLTLALHEIVAAEMDLAGRRATVEQVRKGNRRATRAQAKLVGLIAESQVQPAAELWRRHMQAIGQVLLHTVGPASVVDILD